MGNCRKVYCCNFTQTHYFNPGFSFSATVGFVQTCCSWEWSWPDMENIRFPLPSSLAGWNEPLAPSAAAGLACLCLWQPWLSSQANPKHPSLGKRSNIPGVCCQILQLGLSQLPVEISDFVIKTTLCDILLALYFLLSFSGNKIVTKAVI